MADKERGRAREMDEVRKGPFPKNQSRGVPSQLEGDNCRTGGACVGDEKGQ